jgi:hypothetical protein
MLITVFLSPLQADPKAEQDAVAAADAWLSLVDQNRYSDSWQQAASYFQEAIDVDQWVKSMQTVRKPFGKVLSRKISSKQYTQSLPGAPDGHYVVIQFQSVFELKKGAVETVTPMLDTDGKWKVSGYFIR